MEDLLESFELVVGLEVKGDLPLLLQKGNGGQEIVSCYRVLCLKVISRFPWIYKYSNIISNPDQCSNGDVVQYIGWIGLDHFNGPTHPTLSNTVSSKHDSGNWLCIKTLCLTCLCAAPSFHLNLGLLLRLPQRAKNQEKTREPRDEEDQSHAEVKHKKNRVGQP